MYYSHCTICFSFQLLKILALTYKQNYCCRFLFFPNQVKATLESLYRNQGQLTSMYTKLWLYFNLRKCNQKLNLRAGTRSIPHGSRAQSSDKRWGRFFLLKEKSKDRCHIVRDTYFSHRRHIKVPTVAEICKGHKDNQYIEKAQERL